MCVGKSKEYYINIKENKCICFYDFTIPKLKIIIEYNGIAFHPNHNWNVNLWNNWKSAYYKESADIKYKFDLNKKQIALNKGFDYIEIYSDENLKNKQQEII